MSTPVTNSPVGAAFSQTQSEPIRFSASSSLPILDPRQARTLLHLNSVRLLFSSPTRLTANGEIEMDLAESIEGKGTRYIITLRKMFWPDGTLLIAEDLIYSWQSTLERERACPNAHYLFCLKNGAKAHNGEEQLEKIGLHALSDSSLEVTLETPCTFFLQLLSTPAFCVVQKAYAQREGAFQEGSSLQVSGPYTVQEALETKVRLLPNSNYWEDRDLPALDFFVTDDETALTMFNQNQLDWIGSPLGSLPAETIVSSGQEEGLSTTPSAGTYFLRFNTTTPLLSDVRVRKALFLSIDKISLVEGDRFRKPVLASSFTPPYLLSQKEVTSSHEENIESAQELLSSYCKENGCSLDSLKITLSFHTANPINIRIAEAVKINFQTLGITVETDSTTSQDFYSNLKATKYEVGVCSWFADYYDPHAFLSIFEFAQNGTNNTNWESSSYQALLGKSIEVVDPKERETYLHGAEEVLVKEAPIVPLFHSSFVYKKSSGADQIHLSSLGYIDPRG